VVVGLHTVEHDALLLKEEIQNVLATNADWHITTSTSDPHKQVYF